jgi:hypothetical protein
MALSLRRCELWKCSPDCRNLGCAWHGPSLLPIARARALSYTFWYVFPQLDSSMSHNIWYTCGCFRPLWEHISSAIASQLP